MDFKEYFDTYSAQKKINKLAKMYKNRKIVLYGAGQYADTLFKYFDLSKLNIVAICDKKFEDESKRDFYNLICIPPQELGSFDCDLILISNFDYQKFSNIVDDILYETQNEAVEIRPLIKLNFADLFLKNKD